MKSQVMASVGTRTLLEAGWSVQSSAELEADGARLSRSGNSFNGYRARVPTTVVAALVENGKFANPYAGKNFERLPGRGPLGENFSNLPMPEDSPFRVPWWYRTEFYAPSGDGRERYWLELEGINYRANVWLNGELVADAGKLVGAYRAFELDVTERLLEGRPNGLAIEVLPPQPNDLALTWVDWNPCPPDKNMGLWRPVALRTTGSVRLVAPQVVTTIDGTSARVTVTVELHNGSERAEECEVIGLLEGREFRDSVVLAPGASQRVIFEPQRIPALLLTDPRLWWPRALGRQDLYEVSLRVNVRGCKSDCASVRFGIREVRSELTRDNHTVFLINGRRVLIRGAGFAGDMLLRPDAERAAAHIEYVKEMNLNAIRFEGMLEQNSFLERCDREGILVIAGWCCCDHWEKWDNWKEEDYEVAAESLRSEVRRVRNHPCLISWWYGSDFPPPPRVEQRYLDVLREEHWPNPSHSSAANKPTPVTGESGMKMAGPYEYVPPNYWLTDSTRGGAFGFATEISPGPAIPPLESLKEMLGEQHLWPADDCWRLHCGGGPFQSLTIFDAALARRYGEPKDVADYAQKAQLMTYEAERAMFEAYSKRKYLATGVIQWMLNNAWPSLIWHLYDYYLCPGGGYFGTKKACEPLHVLYAYDDASVWVVNEFGRSFSALTVEARIYDSQSREVRVQSATIEVPADGSVRALPPLEHETRDGVYFIRLELREPEGTIVSRNFYWLSSQPDVLDHARAQWYYTPCSAFADFSALSRLPPAEVEASVELSENPRAARLHLQNRGALAFFIEARLLDGEGREILPVFWQDNYVSLCPGESRSLLVRVDGSIDESAQVKLSGCNLAPRVLRVGG
jgi:exo-1,4-beta-D-glucosaminidase